MEMSVNQFSSALSGMTNPLSGGQNQDTGYLSKWGIDDAFSMELEKMEKLIEEQTKKTMQSSTIDEQEHHCHLCDKTDSIIDSKNNEEKENDENSPINLIETPEGTSINTSIRPNINLNHITEIIEQYFENFMETSFTNFSRKTKGLLETVNRALQAPQTDDTIKNRKINPYNVIVNSITTELTILYESVSFSNEEMDTFTKEQFIARFEHVLQTFEASIPELSKNKFPFELNNEDLLNSEI